MKNDRLDCPQLERVGVVKRHIAKYIGMSCDRNGYDIHFLILIEGMNI